jgi:hypothetical protein
VNTPTYSTIKQFCERHPAFPYGGVRGLVFNENKNGLADAGAIVRMGRKVLINESKFFAWLENSSSK